MSAAEVILRIGITLVGWLTLYAHALTIAVVPMAHCSTADESLWSGTLVLAALAGLGALSLHVALPWRSTLRWLAVPALPLFALGIWVSAGFLMPALDGASLCSVQQGVPDAGPAPDWQRFWPGAQLTVFGIATLQAARYWRVVGAEGG